MNLNSLIQEQGLAMTRRHFFSKGSNALGFAALTNLLGSRAQAASTGTGSLNHFMGKARNVIYLHMVGGPPQMDLFDYKPKMQDWYDKDLPDSI